MKYILTEKQLKLIEEKIGLSSKVIELTNEIIEKLKESNFKFDFQLKLNNSNFDFKDLPIYNFIIEVENIKKNTGRINIKEVYNQYGEKEFSCLLNLYLDFNNIDFILIESIITHEIHHLNDRIIREEKERYNPNLIKFVNELKIEYFNNILIKEFVNMIYLSLDEEINARVQQLSVDLKNVSKENFREELRKTQPYIDSQRLMNYDIEKLNKLSDEEKNDLLKKLNFTNFDNLKKYYSKRFKMKGMKLYEKLLKLSGFLYGLKESFLVNEFVDDFLNLPESCFEVNPHFGKQLLSKD